MKKTVELIHESDQIYLDFGADKNVYGVDKEKEIREIRRRAINANLKLIECPIRHLGTEEGYKIYSRLEDHLKEIGVEMKFNTMVNDITIEDGRATAVTLEDGTVYEADEIVSAVGREEPTGSHISATATASRPRSEPSISVSAWKSATRSWSS